MKIIFPLSILFAFHMGCAETEKDTGADEDTSGHEDPVEPETVEPETVEPETTEPSYQGPVPDGTLGGCRVVNVEVNDGLYCFENELVTAESCDASYLQFEEAGCPAEDIIASCSAIPVEGDYLAESTGYWYTGAVGTEDACGDVGGTWEGLTE